MENPFVELKTDLMSFFVLVPVVQLGTGLFSFSSSRLATGCPSSLRTSTPITPTTLKHGKTGIIDKEKCRFLWIPLIESSFLGCWETQIEHKQYEKRKKMSLVKFNHLFYRENLKPRPQDTSVKPFPWPSRDPQPWQWSRSIHRQTGNREWFLVLHNKEGCDPNVVFFFKVHRNTMIALTPG